ncbi:pleckstrin homology domain-containing family G member 6 [Betta splendens]|uniref:Pleckstrin homology domain-containing family G member 6 n=1 Tax=Betta splendens TaxID=158456 RepID=A0A6P7KQD7_BETSP|nr:pleckstrin homology domain-containing family G member 6 [Betta splendens]
MDPTKPSLHVNSGGGHESSMEDKWQDTVDGERDQEGREPDVVNGTTAAAEVNNHHKGAADKHKFSTIGHQKRTRQKLVTDFGTVSKGSSAGGKPRAALRQALFNQGGSDKNLPSEDRGQLDALKRALQAYAVPASLKWSWREHSQGTTLEKNWTELVHSHSTLAKVQRHQQEALWEFVHTELTYINKLIIIKDLVIAALVHLRQRGFLLEVTPEQLFSNLPAVLSAHQLFWQEVVHPMLQEVRRTGRPFDPLMLEAGCLQFHQRFDAYKHYCLEEDNNLEFSRKQMENNPHFQTYIQWVETHPQCDRMRLGDMQAKPHQRITKYPLLLKAVLRSTQDPRTQRTLRAMLSSVNRFLTSINDYLRVKDEELALSISAQRVEGYVVEGISEEIDKHVKEICQFELTSPISGLGPSVVRKLLLEGNLKLRGRKDNKLEVVALLFSDVLLMTKAQKKGERLKVVRPPLALDRTQCVALKDGSSFILVEVGELHCAMTVYAFTASTPESCSLWTSSIQQATETLRGLRATEARRQMETWKRLQPEAQVVPEADGEDSDTETESLTESEKLTLEALEIPLVTDGVDEMEEEEEMVVDSVSPGNTVCLLRGAPAGGQTILVEDLPDVDYPTDEDSSSQPDAPSWELLYPRQTTTRRNSDSPLGSHNTRRNSSNSEPGDMGTSNGTWRPHRHLRSPGLERKRPVSTLQGQVSNRGSSETVAASHNSFSFNNDSDFNLNAKRTPLGQSLGSHRVLKLGSLKPNQGMFWSMHDSQTLSDPNSASRMSHQRGAVMSTSPQERDTQTEPYLNEHPSILEGLLERAKDRERNGFKPDHRPKMADQSSRYPPLSPARYTARSPSASDGDSEGAEKEVKLVRRGAASVSMKWKEQLVDEDSDERENSVALVDGVNVDWTGWCFDDNEVMCMYHVEGDGLLEDINRSLYHLYIPQLSGHEEGECSQV